MNALRRVKHESEMNHQAQWSSGQSFHRVHWTSGTSNLTDFNLLMFTARICLKYPAGLSVSTTSSPSIIFSLPSKFLINLSSWAWAAEALGSEDLSLESAAAVRNRLCPRCITHQAGFWGMSVASLWNSDYGALTHHVEKHTNYASLENVNHFLFME